MKFSRRDVSKGLLSVCAVSALQPMTQVFAASPKTITLNVGFPAGGVPDVVARTLAERLQALMQKNIVVVNRVGAGGQLAVSSLKAAPADGSVYALSTPATLTLFPHLYSNLSYDAERDIVPVAAVCSYFLAVVVNNNVPVKTTQELWEWCKKNPDQATCGIPGAGTSIHFLTEKIAELTGVKFRTVPYKGAAALSQAVVTGEIACSINLTNNFSALHNSGKLKMLAVSSPERLPQTPEVPTFAESGLAKIAVPEWMGVVANAKTPKAEIDAMYTAVQQVLAEPGFKEKLAIQQCVPTPMTADAFAQMIKSGSRTWKEHIQKTGFKIDA
ncbi:MAG: tripartite tricarboxylate transporter substrate-binding protein [Comamonas sp.]